MVSCHMKNHWTRLNLAASAIWAKSVVDRFTKGDCVSTVVFFHREKPMHVVTIVTGCFGGLLPHVRYYIDAAIGRKHEPALSAPSMYVLPLMTIRPPRKPSQAYR